MKNEVFFSMFIIIICIFVCIIILRKYARKVEAFFRKYNVKLIVKFSYKNIELYLFGANGFDDKIKDIKNEHLHLIDLDDMFSK